MDRVAPRLPGKSPSQTKEIINSAIRDELKNPQTQPGKAISDAPSRQLNVPASDLFLPRRSQRPQ